ncbi:hypothetical protein Aph01nite_26670 [Acrocarpospora phusangensis]|uniref:Glyoxalase-like domain-containing protein n=1 Tax=Acrocarpospora phusangensis TaxID=1070424 RepID=A0A919QDN9_9ACTN|nr:VOC family protein [Acrocarpospora phusangensis]GIH24357.1 hypothetical protein Aph01nite_26670 [Acrocarpospora phusangensis]
MSTLIQATVAVHDLTTAGIRERLSLAPGFPDPELASWGITNEILTLGETYIELVAPTGPSSRLNRFLTDGEGGYLLALRVPATATLTRRCAERGVRVIHQQDFHGATITQLHPADLGVLVEADEIPPGRAWHYDTWPAAGVDTSPQAGDILAADVAVADPAAMAELWAYLFDAEVLPGGVVRVESRVVRFVPVQGRRGLVGVDLRATGSREETVELAGLRIRLVPEGS